MPDSQENNCECNEIYEFNGFLDEVSCEIQDAFDNEISKGEAKFIAETLVQIKNYENRAKQKSRIGKQAEQEERYADAGLNTPIGYIVIQTSKLKMQSIHLLYTFIVTYSILGDPTECLAVLDIEVIWLLLNAIKVIKNEDDKLVMSIIIDIDTKNKKKPISINDISQCLKKSYPDETQNFNDDRIKKSLIRLWEQNIIDSAGDYWLIRR